MSDKKIIPVVYASDNNYARYMLVSMYSMLHNLSEGYACEFHLLVSEDFSDENKKMISDRLSRFDGWTVDYISMDDRFDHLVNPVERLSSATLFRLSLPDLLPQTGKCVYIDCDTLVAGDISRLWNEDLEGALVGGSQAHNFTMEEKRHRKRLAWEKDKPFRYVNAGVLLFDLAGMRSAGLVPVMLAEVEKGYYYSDQDIINRTCAGRLKYVHPRYNIRPYYSGWVTEIPRDTEDGRMLDDALADPVAYHYATEFKPWYDTGMNDADKWLAYALNDDLAPLFEDVQRIKDDPLMVKYITMARVNRVDAVKLKNERRSLNRQLKRLEKENLSLKEENEKYRDENEALQKELKKIKAGRAYKVASSLGKLTK